MKNELTLIEIIEILTKSIGDFEDRIFEELKSSGLTAKQIDYIETIGKLENPTMSELAIELKLSKPSITAIIDKLAREGYIQRLHSDQDRRSYHVHLTDKGKSFSKLHDATHARIADVFMKSLSKKELSDLIALLNKVVKKLN